MNSEVKEQKSRIDWMITLMPLALTKINLNKARIYAEFLAKM